MLSDRSFRIGGFVRVDSVNYPGLVACTVFTKGCNFRCPYCHNPSLAIPETMVQNGDDANDYEVFTVDRVLDYIEQRRRLLDGVVVSGGEPCLQDGLLDFLSRAKDMGLSTKLDTNGSIPDKLEEALSKGLLDYVAMDIKTSVSRYVELGCRDVHAVERSVRLVMEKAPDYEFRTTCEKGVVGVDDIERIGMWLSGAKRLYLQRFNPKVTLEPSLGGSVQYGYDELEGFAVVLRRYVERVSIR